MPRIPLAGIQSPPEAPASLGFQPSPQQEAIFDWARRGSGNLIIKARAGTGKTTTLVELCTRLGSGVVYLAFNKNIASEIQKKLADRGLDWKSVKAGTFHSVGFQAWVKHAPQCRNNVRAEKLALLSEKISMPQRYHTFARKLVSLAKQSLIGVPGICEIDDDTAWRQLIEHHDLLDDVPVGDDEIDEEEYVETALAWSLKLLRQSIAEAPTLIDFDDMLYMPLYAGLRFWQYEWVLIDEAQDTNLARREIAKRLLRPRSGRLIAVGDEHQAIYGFTGASADALDLIENDFMAEVLPLTVTYRCPASVVRHAQQWVPDIEARPDAPEGEVRFIDDAEFRKLTPSPRDAILCRNTKPLVQLAFGYLRANTACVIEGRDVGAGLVSLCRKWKSAHSVADLIEKLDEHLTRETERLLAQYKEAQLGALADKIETLVIIAETCGLDAPVQSVIDKINSLFKDTDGLAKQVLTLSTVHKAKGREWPTVYFYGRNALIPSPYAKQEWQLEQEQNLAYVGVTRAQERLIEVLVPVQRRKR